MMFAIYKGKVKDKDGYAVHLFYEYKGHEYMVTCNNNGYSGTLLEQHKYEQKRIDEAINRKQVTKEQAEQSQKELYNAIDDFFNYEG